MPSPYRPAGARERGSSVYQSAATASMAPSDVEALSALIDTVYDAAIERARWSEALEQACRFLNCSAGALLSSDLLGTFGLNVNWGYGTGYWESYQTHYFHLDPLNAAVFRSNIGDVFIGSRLELWPDALASTFYQEWAAPQGLVDAVGGTLDKSASGAAGLCGIRREEQGLADEDSAWRMGLILPHFRRALLISKLLNQHDLRAGAFVEAMDELSLSVFFLDAAGSVLHANQSGREILVVGDPLRLVGKCLAPVDPTAHRAFRQALAGALAVSFDSKSDLSLSLIGKNGDAYAANALPLTSGARREVALTTAAVTALFVRKSSIDIASAIGAATKLYGFTPTEARVLAEIIDKGGLGLIAVRLGVSRRTIQTHLEHLFQKTGSKRQADLVKLVAGHASPLQTQPL